MFDSKTRGGFHPSPSRQVSTDNIGRNIHMWDYLPGRQDRDDTVSTFALTLALALAAIFSHIRHQYPVFEDPRLLALA